MLHYALYTRGWCHSNQSRAVLSVVSSLFWSYLTLYFFSLAYSIWPSFTWYRPRQKSMQKKKKKMWTHDHVWVSDVLSWAQRGAVHPDPSIAGEAWALSLEPKLSHKASGGLLERNNRPFITTNKTKEQDGQVISNLWNGTCFKVFLRVERRYTPRFWRCDSVFRRSLHEGAVCHTGFSIVFCLLQLFQNDMDLTCYFVTRLSIWMDNFPINGDFLK